MDFLKQMIGSQSKGADADAHFSDTLNDVFETAVTDAQTIKNQMMANSKRFVGKDGDQQPGFMACLYLFIVAWLLVQGMYVGVEATNKIKGPRNRVHQLWHLIRTAFSSCDEDTQSKRINAFMGKWNKGEYDEWK